MLQVCRRCFDRMNNDLVKIEKSFSIAACGCHVQTVDSWVGRYFVWTVNEVTAETTIIHNLEIVKIENVLGCDKRYKFTEWLFCQAHLWRFTNCSTRCGHSDMQPRHFVIPNKGYIVCFSNEIVQSPFVNKSRLQQVTLKLHNFNWMLEMKFEKSYSKSLSSKMLDLSFSAKIFKFELIKSSSVSICFTYSTDAKAL